MSGFLSLGGDFAGREFWRETQPFLDAGRYAADKYILRKGQYHPPQGYAPQTWNQRAFDHTTHYQALKKQLRDQKTYLRRHDFDTHRDHYAKTFKRRRQPLQSRTRVVKHKYAPVPHLLRPKRRLPSVPFRKFPGNRWFLPHIYWNPNRIRLF